MVDRKNTFILLASGLILYFAPILINPDQLTNRNNDLLFFKQSYSFFKESIINHNHIPLWQNKTLSGSPYLGDPQNPLLYLPNYLSLFLPLSSFFTIFFVAHFLISLLGTYLLFRYIKFSKMASIAAAFIYAISPKFSAHLEAGHLNLIAAYAWIPFLYYSLLGMANSRRKTNILLLAYSLSAIFLNYITIFAYVFASVLLFIGVNISSFRRRLIPLVFTVVIFVVLILPQLLLALKLYPLSTRSLIGIEDMGKVVSIRQYLHSIFSPYTFGLEKLQTEQVLSAGVIPTILAIVGFFLIQSKKKVFISALAALIVFVSLGTKTYLFTALLIIVPQLLIFRVPSRPWFIVILITAYLSAVVVQKIQKSRLSIFVVTLVIVELCIFNFFYFQKHKNLLDKSSISSAIEKLVTTDTGYYRIYCTVNCPIANVNYKGVTSGYNPILLMNHFLMTQKAGGYQFGLYTLAIPPYQRYPDQPQPSSNEMGKLGVRYVITPYKIQDNGFAQIAKRDNLHVYFNKNELPRAYMLSGNSVEPLLITEDISGSVTVKLTGKTGKLVLNEPYFPYWEVSVNGQTIRANDYNGLVSAELKKGYNIATIRFNPPFSKITIPLSLIISLFVLSSLTIITFKKNAK